MNFEKLKAARGSERERPSRGRGNKTSVSRAEWILLAGLLVLPAWALWHLSFTIQPRYLIGYVIAISTATFFVYRHDKLSALSGGWRTPEATLHFLELSGGWPGAFIAQRYFRHKTAKRSFQVSFWIVVGLHQFGCFDSVNHWFYSKKAASALARLPSLVFG
jgi:uncharacterized membrane protein YsdA (DUF1294 family)